MHTLLWRFEFFFASTFRLFDTLHSRSAFPARVQHSDFLCDSVRKKQRKVSHWNWKSPISTQIHNERMNNSGAQSMHINRWTFRFAWRTSTFFSQKCPKRNKKVYVPFGCLLCLFLTRSLSLCLPLSHPHENRHRALSRFLFYASLPWASIEVRQYFRLFVCLFNKINNKRWN